MAAAASSSSCSSANQLEYDVFLSFRGEDTRNGFTSHLYSALKRNGLRPFIDTERLERGKAIAPELLSAIRRSRTSIVVLSTSYASSSWCLDELVEILQCHGTNQQLVFPVFYDVEPSVVRKQKESYKEPFDRHAQAFSADKVQRWKTALTDVANLSGWHLGDGCESELIEDIVNDISSKISHALPSTLEDHLIGIEERLEGLNACIDIQSSDVRMIGIWGMGGIGKTTLARALYKRISHNHFQAKSFLADVREGSRKGHLVSLQKQLLTETLTCESCNFQNVHDGVDKIRSRLSHKRVLVVVDDVDHLDQLKFLVGGHEWFGSGSRIIITTRDMHLLKTHGVDAMYNVQGLFDDEAFQLFCLKAFKSDQPPKDFLSISREVIRYADGLPLALEVLGSFLYGRRNIGEWEDVVERLKEESEAGILDKLKLSFDGLKETEKAIYLDIACFFRGERRDYVTQLLEFFGFHPVIGLQVLIDRSLITIVDDKLWMHDLLQEMGWKIVRDESVQDPGKRSRLWKEEDIHHVLKMKKVDMEEVKGILLKGDFPRINLNADFFSRIKKLRFLSVGEVKLDHALAHLPSDLRLLIWKKFPLKSLPPGFHHHELGGLIMNFSSMKYLWKGIRVLHKLRLLDLSYSIKLRKTPNLAEVPDLEILLLRGCTSLIEVHQSTGALKKLTILDLRGCYNLVRLPRKIEAKSIKELFLPCKSNLRTYPEILGKVHLVLFDLWGTLTHLCFWGCKHLASLPPNILKWQSFTEIELKWCPKLRRFPDIVERMEWVKKVSLWETGIEQIPSSIANLAGLEQLELRKCQKLSCLPHSICKLTSLKILILWGCSKLTSLPVRLGYLKSLEVLDIRDCKELYSLPESIWGLTGLETLVLRGCSKVTTLPGFLGLLKSLRTLDLSNCKGLYCLPDSVSCFISLERLILQGCSKLISLPMWLGNLESLQLLDIRECQNLIYLPDSIWNLTLLEILVGCSKPVPVFRFGDAAIPTLSGLKSVANDCLVNRTPSLS